MPALIRGFAGKVPRLGGGVFVADNATIIGDVEIGEDSSVWYGCVLRGDVGAIRIGARTNIQDLSMVHMTTLLSNSEIADDVTVGHGAILHGARVESGVLVGMGAILLDNCVIGEGALVAAGSLVPIGMQVPPRTLVRGSPARVIRELNEDEVRRGRDSATHYVELAKFHRQG